MIGTPQVDRVPKADWPNVEITHLSFQIMVGSGMALLAVSAWFWWDYYWSRGQISGGRWLLRAVTAGGGTAIRGRSHGGNGISGVSDHGDGVIGESVKGAGVVGSSM